MNRTSTWLVVAVLALLSVSCGGGASSNLPGGSTGGNTQKAKYQLAGPSSVTGTRGVENVPGQVNVLTSAKGGALSSLAAKFGYTVQGHSGDWVTLGLPAGVTVDEAKLKLEKEFNVTSVAPVTRIVTPRVNYAAPTQRNASFTPLDPAYGDQTRAFFFDGTNVGLGDFVGQGIPMSTMGFNSAWDVALNPSVAAEPVKIAIIDAGWLDYTTAGARPGFDETLIDPNSAFIADNGTATPGLANIVWEFTDDGDPATGDPPFRATGEYLLGILAADMNTLTPRAFDLNNDTTITHDEIWNEGFAGINPNASYLLIKTGALVGQNWTFSDNSIAHSIDYAVTNGANIILLGMFANGNVAPVVSTAIQNARDNDVLVVAPAGDVTDSFNAGTFTGTPVDITTTQVTPASDPNVVSVTATGVNRINPAGLPLLDTDGDNVGDTPNDGIGYLPIFGAPVNESISELGAYDNTGATIAGVGYAISFGFRPFLVSGAGTIADPAVLIPGDNYNTVVSNFGTTAAAAYVAGAASQVFQTLSFVNGTPPTDDDVLAELLSSVQFAGMTGVAGTGPGTGGLLNAGAAMTSAINGGNLNTILPALAITNLQVSQPFAAVTRATDFDVTVNVANGTAPFDITVDWDNGGNPPNITDVPNWTNNTAVTLTGGYTTLGLKIVNVQVKDADGRIATASFQVHVINPLTAGITVEDANGAAVTVTAGVAQLKPNTAYRFKSNAANVYTGDVGGTLNVTTFGWDWGTGSLTAGTGPNPALPSPFYTAGDYTVTLSVNETVRPDQTFTLNVHVAP